MRVVFCAWIIAQLIAAVLPGKASAGAFVLSDPRVDSSWGRQSAQPIAPSSTDDADAGLPNDLTGQARAMAYVEALTASRVTLDEAARFHFYAQAYGGAFDTRPDRPHVQLETGPTAGAYAAAAGEKTRAAEPILQAELDARFVALTAAMEQAGSIVLPSPAAPVTYCRWIARTVHSPMPPLAAALWKNCMAGRDRSSTPSSTGWPT